LTLSQLCKQNVRFLLTSVLRQLPTPRFAPRVDSEPH